MATEGRNGGKKTGGRVKGSVNKSKDEIKELLDANVDWSVLVGKLVELSNGVSIVKINEKGQQIVYQNPPDSTASKILLEYRYGKPQQKVELSGQVTEIVVSKTIIKKNV